MTDKDKEYYRRYSAYSDTVFTIGLFWSCVALIPLIIFGGGTTLTLRWYAALGLSYTLLQIIGIAIKKSALDKVKED